MIGVYNFLNKFNYLLSKKDRIVIIFLIGFSIIVSLFEIVGITAILPYITLLSNPEAIQENVEIEESLSLEEREKELIIKALEKHNGRRKNAALELGISERTLYRKIKEYDIHK